MSDKIYLLLNSGPRVDLKRWGGRVLVQMQFTGVFRGHSIKEVCFRTTYQHFSPKTDYLVIASLVKVKGPELVLDLIKIERINS